MYRLISVGLSIIMLVGCISPLPQREKLREQPSAFGTIVHPMGLPVTGTVKLKPFSRIVSNGFHTLDIQANQNEYSIEITADKEILRYVKADVRNGTLYISMEPNLTYDNPGPIKIVVKTRYLTYLDIKGNTPVNIVGLQQSEGLSMSSSTNSSVKLLGTMCLKKIDYRGNGCFSAYFVNSNRLTIHGEGCGKIFLVGQACRVDAEVFDSVILDLKYLHTKTAYINTSDYARAEVSVYDSLNMLASGHSNIYYYITPRFVAPYMRDSAVIASQIMPERFCSPYGPFCETPCECNY